jgi:tetratricopeptide (TPR) repeat protein
MLVNQDAHGQVRKQGPDIVVWGLATLLLLATVGFGLFYYMDRYVSRHDTLVERQIQQLTERVQQNPADVGARVTIAEWYLRNGMVDEAIAQGQEVRKLDENNQGALILLAQAYLAKGDKDAAIQAFTQVADLSRGTEFATVDRRMNEVYYNLGVLYQERAEPEKAIEAYQAALAVDRTDADAHYRLGMTLQATGDHTAAIGEFDEALRFVPNFAEAYAGLQTSYAALGSTAQAQYAQAMLAYLKQQYAEAATLLEAAKQQEPDFAPIDLGLGLVYAQTGDTDKAVQALHRYLEVNPDSVVGQQTLGRLAAEAPQQ